MCGITGFVELSGAPASREAVEKMSQAIKHRGPNDSGVFVNGSAAFAHRRLSILDVTSSGHQPMQDSLGRYTITFNGEVYNYLEIRRELGGRHWKSGSDTEVMLEAYAMWGKECLSHFNGIFSFALWDAAEKELFCARDRLGVKPFYYAVHEGRFLFASEIKALLAAGVPARPNDRIVRDYLVFGMYEHSEETFFEGIQQLMPGHALTIKDGKITIFRYWNLPERVADLSGLSDADVSERYRALVDDAVGIQLRSDVPIGINASGGLDCSILTETVNRLCGGQRNFEMYSWNYGEEQYDETPYVKELSRHLGWNVNFVTLTPKDALAIMPDVMRHEEQPFPGISIVARHNLYRHTKPETIVFLEGHGGDEIGGGYEYYISSFLLDVMERDGMDAGEKELAAYGALHGITSKKTLQDFFLRGLRSYFSGGTSADATSFIATGCLHDDFLSRAFPPKPVFDAPFSTHLANMQYRDLHWTKQPRVLRSVDRNSMAYAKEVRVPFLDHRIVEFAFSLPPRQKIRNGEQRFFMREAFRSRLSPSIVNAPKRAVPDPQRAWLKGALRPWAEEALSSPEFGRRAYVDQKRALAEYRRYCETKDAANSFHIWQWLNMEMWFRQLIDK